MTIIRWVCGTALAAVVSVAGACSSEGGASGPGGGSAAPLEGSRRAGVPGEVQLHLNIGGGPVTISVINYTLSNGSDTYDGTVDLTDDAGNAAQSVEFVVGGVAAGSGYVMSLYGADSEGDPCSGASSPITVSTGATAEASVQVTCTVPTDSALPLLVDSGSVAVDAGITITDQSPFGCPGIRGVSISPAELRPPETATLTAASTSGSGGTETFLWSATCGSGTPVITNPTSPDATFSCGTAFATTCSVTLTVGLLGTGLDGGSVGPVCTGAGNTTVTETIACEDQCVSALGQSPAPEGTPCNENGGTICNGAGSCVPFTFQVARVGAQGATSITTNATSVFLETHAVADGSLSAAPLLPATTALGGTNPFTVTGTSVTEADLTRSDDGRFLSLVGYATVAGTATPTSSTSTPRVVVRVDHAGVVDTSTLLSFMVGTDVLFGAGNPRSTASIDGSGFWVGGTGATSGTTYLGGLWWVPFGPMPASFSTSNQLIASSVRDVRTFAGQLYADGDTSATPAQIFTVGSGDPTGGIQPTAMLAGMPAIQPSSASLWSFAVFPSINTLYLASSAVVALDGGSYPMGILKFTRTGGTWSLATSFGPPGGLGVRSLAAMITPGTSQVTLMATSVEPGKTSNHAYVFVDSGTAITAGPSFASPANTLYRGVALTPHP